MKKVCVITGGSSGIGRALAFKFGGEGYSIAISGRNQEKLNDTVGELGKVGIEAFSLKADVSKLEDCIRFKDMVKEKLGRADVLINNAGISMRAMFRDLDPKVIKELIDINLMGSIYCTKAFLDLVIFSKGTIVGVSSIAGYRGLPARTGYSASKFGLQGFLEALRVELIPEGVHVLTACPGFTESNIRKAALTADGTSQGESPLNEGKIMSSEEVAGHIYKGVIQRKKSIVLTTQGKMTVLMNKLFPGFMDKMVFNHFAKEENSPLKKT